MKKESYFSRVDKIYVATENVKNFASLANALKESGGAGSTSMGIVKGEAGKGKTFAAKWYCVQNPEAVYIYYMTASGIATVYRSIAAEIADVKYRTIDKCVDAIKSAVSGEKRLVVLDEADKASTKIIDSLRDLNEVCGLPILLVGETKILSIVEKEKRLRSRILDVVSFDEITLKDVATFVEKVFKGLEVDSKLIKKIYTLAKGDFRPVVRLTKKIAKFVDTNGVRLLEYSILKELK
jgi:DNA transposition AAA+ family ATPase